MLTLSHFAFALVPSSAPSDAAAAALKSLGLITNTFSTDQVPGGTDVVVVPSQKIVELNGTP